MKIAKSLETGSTTNLLEGKQKLNDYTGYCGNETSPNLGVKAGFLRGLHLFNLILLSVTLVKVSLTPESPTMYQLMS